MRNRLKEVERLHDMKVDNLNRKIASVLKELAVLKKSSNKKTAALSKAEKEAIKRENLSPKEEILTAAVPEKQVKPEPADLDKDEKSRDREEERSEQEDTNVENLSWVNCTRESCTCVHKRRCLV